SRKYGLARALSHEVSQVRHQPAWVHVNDVAGFIGPEVFRSREPLVRCCLEDLVMGKLHGLTIGLDVCSTLHMDVTLADLDWCLEEIAPAAPAYLMALPTKIDPMLGYLTTGYQDHVRLREKFGYRVNDAMWKFFQELQIIDAAGQPTEHFGDPVWVYMQYRRRQGDLRSAAIIQAEAELQLAEVQARGVFIARGHGQRTYDLSPKLASEIDKIYHDAKACIWEQWRDEFVRRIPEGQSLRTQSKDRTDYIWHPDSGERLSAETLSALQSLRAKHQGRYAAQIVISEGLNALALMDEGNLLPLLEQIRRDAESIGLTLAPENLVVTSGRVRAGYKIGETLFGGLAGERTIIHIIGERPGSGHHTMSVYITRAAGQTWQTPGQVDHNITRVVSGIATTALSPISAAREVRRLLG
ncbi:MAG: ethanolamine ammonia-lyase subunit EutB, partial [Pirellulaceae bacterium]|nr:ethanolamine ammonia-lyase subunit EutB [Pirellulaceae bacterium]